MITLISTELFKIFRKWRTYISFFAIFALVPIVHLAVYLEGGQWMNYLTRTLQDIFVFSGNLINGYFVAHMVLGSLIIHIPFLITLVTGDLLAGEATAGTYRMLLTRPVSRLKVATAKFLAGFIYTNSLILWLAIMSLGLGVLFFGTGELVIMSGDITILARNDIIWRFLLAYGFAVLSMTTVASISFLLSSLVENAIGPIVGTMAIIIVFLILSNLNIGFLKDLSPYLFTSYFMDWRLFFEKPMDGAEILKSVLVLGGHIVCLFGITLYIFRKKDILS